MNTFSFKKDNFYGSNTQEEFNESFLINACDEVVLTDNRQNKSGIYLQIDFYKKNKDLLVDVALLSWSNSQQKHMPLEQSVWEEESFGNGLNIPILQKHYKKIVLNFFAALETLKHHWQLKNLIHRIEHPTFIFHYKLLNLFTQQELKNIMLKYFSNHAILNVSIFQKPPKYKTLDYAFLPHIVNGFYIDDIEVSVDLNERDLPLLEDIDSGIISKEEFLKRIDNL